MNPTIEGFAEFHGLKGVTMLDEYIKSLRGSDDLCETMENMKPFKEECEKPETNIDYDKTKCMCRLFNNGIAKQCSRKKVDEEIYCKSHLNKFTDEGIWGFGLINEVIPENHVNGSKNEGQRIRWRSDVKSIQKSKKVRKSIEKIVVVKNLDTQFDESSDIENCSKCNNPSSNNQFTIVDSSKYCLLCYKSYIEDLEIKCQDPTQLPKDDLSDDDLLSEDNNDYIYYQGVHYYYDKFTNIVALDYEEMGIWDDHDKSIDWYNDECMKKHMENSDYSNE